MYFTNAGTVIPATVPSRKLADIEITAERDPNTLRAGYRDMNQEPLTGVGSGKFAISYNGAPVGYVAVNPDLTVRLDATEDEATVFQRTPKPTGATYQANDKNLGYYRLPINKVLMQPNIATLWFIQGDQLRTGAATGTKALGAMTYNGVPDYTTAYAVDIASEKPESPGTQAIVLDVAFQPTAAKAT